MLPFSKYPDHNKHQCMWLKKQAEKKYEINHARNKWKTNNNKTIIMILPLKSWFYSLGLKINYVYLVITQIYTDDTVFYFPILFYF